MRNLAGQLVKGADAQWDVTSGDDGWCCSRLVSHSSVSFGWVNRHATNDSEIILRRVSCEEACGGHGIVGHDVIMELWPIV